MTYWLSERANHVKVWEADEWVLLRLASRIGWDNIVALVVWFRDRSGEAVR